MPEWIRFSEPRAKRYHARLADNSERIVTVCGRTYDRELIRDSTFRPSSRCAACAARLAGKAAYLIPRGPEVDRLLESRQLRLLETRQNILGLEHRRLKQNIARQTARREQRG